jgi:hypothetical protein
VRVPPALERAVLLRFDSSAVLHTPLPSDARKHTDALQRLPQEAVGLWAAPRPRISHASLYKLEQRLAKGARVDAAAIAAALQEQWPDARQPGLCVCVCVCVCGCVCM